MQLKAFVKPRRWTSFYVNLEAFAELTIVGVLGKNQATHPGFSCPLRSLRTPGDTAQPSLSLQGQCHTLW